MKKFLDTGNIFRYCWRRNFSTSWLDPPQSGSVVVEEVTATNALQTTLRSN